MSTDGGGDVLRVGMTLDTSEARTELDSFRKYFNDSVVYEAQVSITTGFINPIKEEFKSLISSLKTELQGLQKIISNIRPTGTPRGGVGSEGSTATTFKLPSNFSSEVAKEIADSVRSAMQGVAESQIKSGGLGTANLSARLDIEGINEDLSSRLRELYKEIADDITATKRLQTTKDKEALLREATIAYVNTYNEEMREVTAGLKAYNAAINSARTAMAKAAQIETSEGRQLEGQRQRGRLRTQVVQSQVSAMDVPFELKADAANWKEIANVSNEIAALTEKIALRNDAIAKQDYERIIRLREQLKVLQDQATGVVQMQMLSQKNIANESSIDRIRRQQLRTIIEHNAYRKEAIALERSSMAEVGKGSVTSVDLQRNRALKTTNEELRKGIKLADDLVRSFKALGQETPSGVPSLLTTLRSRGTQESNPDVYGESVIKGQELLKQNKILLDQQVQRVKYADDNTKMVDNLINSNNTLIKQNQENLKTEAQIAGIENKRNNLNAGDSSLQRLHNVKAIYDIEKNIDTISAKEQVPSSLRERYAARKAEYDIDRATIAVYARMGIEADKIYEKTSATIRAKQADQVVSQQALNDLLQQQTIMVGLADNAIVRATNEATLNIIRQDGVRISMDENELLYENLSLIKEDVKSRQDLFKAQARLVGLSEDEYLARLQSTLNAKEQAAIYQKLMQAKAQEAVSDEAIEAALRAQTIQAQRKLQIQEKINKELGITSFQQMREQRNYQDAARGVALIGVSMRRMDLSSVGYAAEGIIRFTRSLGRIAGINVFGLFNKGAKEAVDNIDNISNTAQKLFDFDIEKIIPSAPASSQKLFDFDIAEIEASISDTVTKSSTILDKAKEKFAGFWDFIKRAWRNDLNDTVQMVEASLADLDKTVTSVASVAPVMRNVLPELPKADVVSSFSMEEAMNEVASDMVNGIEKGGSKIASALYKFWREPFNILGVLKKDIGTNTKTVVIELQHGLTQMGEVIAEGIVIPKAGILTSEQIIPATLVEKLNAKWQSIQDVLYNIPSNIKTTFTRIPPLPPMEVGDFLDSTRVVVDSVIQPFGIRLYDAITEPFSKIASGIKQSSIAIYEAIVEPFQKVGNTLIEGEFIPNFIGAIHQGFAQIKFSISKATVGLFSKEELGRAVPDALAQLFGGKSTASDAEIRAMLGLPESADISSILSDIGSSMFATWENETGTYIKQIPDSWVASFNNIRDKGIEALGDLADKIGGVLGNAFRIAKDHLIAFGVAFTEIFVTMPKDMIVSFGTSIGSLGKSIASAFVSGFGTAKKYIKDTAVTLALYFGPEITKLNNMFNVVWDNVFAPFIVQAQATVIEFKRLFNYGLIDAKALIEPFMDFISTVGAGLGSLWSYIESGFSSLGSSIVDFFSEMPNVVSTIFGGIGDAVGFIGEAFKNVAVDSVQWWGEQFGKIPGIVGPIFTSLFSTLGTVGTGFVKILAVGIVGAFASAVVAGTALIGLMALMVVKAEAFEKRLWKSVEAFAQLQVGQLRFNTIMGSMADKAEESAQKFSKTFITNIADVRESLSKLAMQLQTVGLSEAQALPIAEQLQERIADMAAMYGEESEKITQAIFSMLNKQPKPLRTLTGISITESMTERRSQQMIDRGELSGKFDSELNLRMARMSLVMEKTSKATGAFAQQVEEQTLNIKKQKVDEEWTKMRQRWAEAMEPIYKVFADFSIEQAEDWNKWIQTNKGLFEDLAEALRKLLPILAALARTGGSAIIGFIKGLLGQLGDNNKPFQSGYGGGAAQLGIYAGGGAAIMGAGLGVVTLGAKMATFTGIVGKLGVGVTTIGNAFVQTGRYILGAFTGTMNLSKSLQLTSLSAGTAVASLALIGVAAIAVYVKLRREFLALEKEINDATKAIGQGMQSNFSKMIGEGASVAIGLGNEQYMEGGTALDDITNSLTRLSKAGPASLEGWLIGFDRALGKDETLKQKVSDLGINVVIAEFLKTYENSTKLLGKLKNIEFPNMDYLNKYGREWKEQLEEAAHSIQVGLLTGTELIMAQAEDLDTLENKIKEKFGDINFFQDEDLLSDNDVDAYKEQVKELASLGKDYATQLGTITKGIQSEMQKNTKRLQSLRIEEMKFGIEKLGDYGTDIFGNALDKDSLVKSLQGEIQDLLTGTLFVGFEEAAAMIEEARGLNSLIEELDKSATTAAAKLGEVSSVQEYSGVSALQLASRVWTEESTNQQKTTNSLLKDIIHIERDLLETQQRQLQQSQNFVEVKMRNLQSGQVAGIRTNAGG